MAQNPSSPVKPVVIGIYGIPGAGKTTLLNQLRIALGEGHFLYFEGSDEIGKLVCGGITSFQILDHKARHDFRELAISCIKDNCIAHGKTGVVTGHLMFWNEGKKSGSAVYTKSDLDTYTQILYLDVPAKEIVKRRLDDPGRDRSHVSVNHVQRWVEAEKRMLRDLCYRNNILFCAVTPSMIPKEVEHLLYDFNKHDEQHNLSNALNTLDSIPAIKSGTLGRMIVLDADRILTSQDTGDLFWKKISPLLEYGDGERPKTPVQVVFESPLGYRYDAFWQVTLLHEGRLRDDEYDSVCKDIASSVTLDGEFLNFLHLIVQQEHVTAVVVTCGLAQIWKYVLELEGLQEKITVIGGGRISDGFVVTAEVKGALVGHLKDKHHLEVCAFGNSLLDLVMLSRADKAIVVVGDEASKSNDGLKAKQCLRPSHVSPRLTTEVLPIIELMDPGFMDSLVSECGEATKLKVISADKLNPEAVKILMRPMRNANVQGPRLREAHIEEFAVPRPQGHNTTGYQLWGEDKILIVASMRGGEPMASGVNRAFGRAMFMHANQPIDLQHDHLEDRFAVILVDSVVNSGGTILDFVRHIRDLNKEVPVVVIAEVMQAECVSGGRLTAALAKYDHLQFITLRISENKYKGTGASDTRSRLFNTLHLT
ncbi:uracil phosphoribosyltransferase-domain-containing protein [Aspergillus sergii]|uniref:Uracil phosphoribosyltransferase-domain-containing protein n=1 Tax=Aspergillus sergii TaxID=1034303 RepID=A0A5N6WNY7_9EURO|nr:uracil phosphoribosyltransferase-domain-containing protein [Aspergillus sergii]